MHKNTKKINTRAKQNKSENRGSSRTEQPRSSNQDFRKLVWIANKYMACLHHEKNWENIPKSVANKVTEIVNSIHLPCTEKYGIGRNYYTKQIIDTLHVMGNNNLHDTKGSLRTELALSNKADYEWAIKIASAQMRRRLKRKVTDESLHTFETETKKMFDENVAENGIEAVNPDDESFNWYEDDVDKIESPAKTVEKARPISPTTAKPNSPTKQTTAETSNSTPIKTTQQKANSPPSRSPIKPPTRPSDQKANSPPHSPVKPPAQQRDSKDATEEIG